jgi:hypothetical protein
VSPRVGRRGGGERFDLFLVEVSTRISGYMTAAAMETISLLPVMPSKKTRVLGMLPIFCQPRARRHPWVSRLHATQYT